MSIISSLFVTDEILPKGETTNSKFKKKWFCKFSVDKSEEKKSKNCHMHIFHFQLVAKNIKGWLKLCILLLVYSQIWLNLARADNHLGYIKNFLKNHYPFDSIHTCIQEPHSHVNHLTCSCLVIEVWICMLSPKERA